MEQLEDGSSAGGMLRLCSICNLALSGEVKSSGKVKECVLPLASRTGASTHVNPSH